VKGLQNRPEADRLSLARGLAEARPVMAALVRRFGGLPGLHQRNRLWHGASLCQ
jgi:hypothetical protein